MKIAPMTNEKQPNARPSSLNAVQRYTVRILLLAGAMVAALIGAQAMEVIDKSASTVITVSPSAAANTAITVTTTPAPTVKPKATAKPTRTVTPVK